MIRTSARRFSGNILRKTEQRAGVLRLLEVMVTDNDKNRGAIQP
jgi:hypothetical protein